MSTTVDHHRATILVVDDESVIADTLVEILNRCGYDAVSATDGEGALEIAVVTPPELLITDLVMPGMNGIELAIRLRRIFPECQVILSSGHCSSARLLASAKEAGNQFVFLQKPVHPADLLSHVANSLETAQSHFRLG